MGMRAVVLREGRLVVDRIPDPVPSEGQVLVRSVACGICGSDLHAARHLASLAEAAREADFPVPLDPARDVVLGHEFCAEVLDFGPGCSRKLRPGTRVCSMPALLTEGAPHSLGYSNDHAGGFAERMLLSEALLLPVPAEVPVHVAALTEPLAVGVHAVTKARPGKEDAPLVVGCGPVGLMMVAALRLAGARPIVASDFSPARRAQALRMGADTVVDPQEGRVIEAWGRHVPPGRRALIFECVGVPGMLAHLVREAPAGSRIVVAGVCMQEDRFKPAVAVLKEIELQFVFGYSPEEFAHALLALARGRVSVEGVVTGCVGLNGVAEAFETLSGPNEHVKVLVEPSP